MLQGQVTTAGKLKRIHNAVLLSLMQFNMRADFCMRHNKFCPAKQSVTLQAASMQGFCPNTDVFSRVSSVMYIRLDDKQANAAGKSSFAPHHCRLQQSRLVLKSWHMSHGHAVQRILLHRRPCALAPICAPASVALLTANPPAIHVPSSNFGAQTPPSQ